MKKSILFVMNKLTCGGAEKALISLLQTIDYNTFEVDLFLFRHEGIFLESLPKEVRLLPAPKNFEYYELPIHKSLIEFSKRLDYIKVLNRILLGYFTRTEKNGALVEQIFWKYLSNSLEKNNKEYDLAIGFQEKNPIYFCIDKVNAKKKVGWIHTDYSQLGINREKEKYYLEKLDYIVTVSEELVNKLKEMFPEYSNKFSCIYNIVSTKMINELSNNEIPLEVNKDITKLISVGRLAKEKGLDLSLDAVKLLANKGYKIKWYIVGEGELRRDLEVKIKEYNLEDSVFLLGIKENPYPFIKHSDIFVQTSRFEGKSISIEEAKILGKPILITNFATAKDHIDDQVNGIISDLDSTSIAKKLELLITNKVLRKKLSLKLSEKDYGTEHEINKLYELLN